MSLYHSQPGILAKAACNRRGVRTEYRGIIFKSKSEAGRAMELDGLGYHWQYEPAAFEYVGDDGFKHRYTPDFFISESGVYIEVKGSMNVWNNNLNSVRIACSDGYKVQLARYPKFKLEFVL